MPYYSPKDTYNRYAFLRWWCQNQWWVQIVVPCIMCAGVIGGLLYYWNNERQRQVQDKIFETQYGYMKTHPPELDPDLDEKATAWRVIRMKKNDPSMSIPYKKKQLIVKHWKSIIVDMKPEEIQRLHDLLQDQPARPTDDIEIDVTKFEAPWQGDVTLDDIDPEFIEKAPVDESESPDKIKDLPSDGKDDSNVEDGSAPSENSKSPEKAAPQKNAPGEKSKKDSSSDASSKAVSYLPGRRVPEFLEPILLDSEDDQTTAKGSGETAADNAGNEDLLPNIDLNFISEEEKAIEKNKRSRRKVAKASAPETDEVCPLEDNFLQQREEFIKKALEERNRKIEEFKKSQDPYQFIPSQWKRNPLVI